MPHTMRADIVDVRTRGEDEYTAVIAVNDHVQGTQDVKLADLDTERYMANPVVLWSHETWRPPVGRATELRQDESGRIEADFEFAPDDERAQQIRNLWDRGFLRGASISWQRREDGQDELVEWSLVSVPADSDAVRMARALFGEDEKMGEAEIRDLVMTTLAAETERMTTQIGELRALVTSAVETGAQEETAATDTEIDEATLRAAAAARVELLSLTKPLISSDVDTTDMSERDLLVAAIGDELPDTDSRSTDYLRAKLDGIVERRAAAAQQQAAPSAPSAYGGTLGNGLAIRQMQRERQEAR